MLLRFLRKKFASSVFSWGENLNNLGISGVNLAMDDCSGHRPAKIGTALEGDVKKVVSGFCDSLALNHHGAVFHMGGAHLFQSNPDFAKIVNEGLNSGVADVDCDASSLLFLTNDGKLLEVRSGKQASRQITPVAFPEHLRARFIATGSHASIVVAEDDKVGHTHVLAWGSAAANQGALFLTPDHLDFGHPTELKAISKLINEKHAKVKKLKLVGNSAVILLDNGELITWGDNSTGNLAVPRSELSFIHNNVRLPAQPLELNHLDVKVADFDLSSNVLVLLTTEGQVYLSGFDNILKLKQIPFFEGQRVRAVGASFNHYFLQAEDGTWYANKAFEGQELVKYYGAVGLVQLEPRYFDGASISHISGKYTNAVAF